MYIGTIKRHDTSKNNNSASDIIVFFYIHTMSSTTFVDRIDPFAKKSLKKKSKKSQGSSRYRNSEDVELQQLPQLKG